MKAGIVTILLCALTYSYALERGRDYMKEKICQEFNSLGKDKFHSVALVLNSRKYCNATFEEINTLVKEIVALAEKCCAEGADPDCYNRESLAFSAKSCDANSPFPKHPGIAACCTEEGLSRKLCLAALKHPPKEFYTYEKPSNDELCEAFRKDPQGFKDKFLFEYSSDHSHTPLPLLLTSTTTYLSIIGTCCTQAQPTVCFLKERLERKSLQILSDLSNKACSRYALFGKDKTSLSYLISFTQKSPNASFENVTSLAEGASEVLSKCCDSLEEDCIQKEVSKHTTEICQKLSCQDERISTCCQQKRELATYLCIYSLPWSRSVDTPENPKPTSECRCNEDCRPLELKKYIHYIARIFTYAPEGILVAFHDNAITVANACCSALDPEACFKEEKAPIKLFDLVSKANDMCGSYTHLSFLDFKKRLREYYQKALPNDTEDAITSLVEQRASFASTCCHLNAPPSYCGLKVQSEVTYTCTDNTDCFSRK